MPGHGVIILAAGGASRMGTPKQLLQFHGKSLLAHAASSAMQSGAQSVVVVLGNDARQMIGELPAGVRHVVNAEWERGMGTSVRVGVRNLVEESSSIGGAVLMLCDQPMINGGMIADLVEAAKREGKPIAAAEYGGTLGTPCYFARGVFDELLVLPDDRGAKGVILKDMGRVMAVPMPEAAMDVDTPEDFKSLEQSR